MSSYSCHWLQSRFVRLRWACWGEAERGTGLWEGLPVAETPPRTPSYWRRGLLCSSHTSITPLLTEKRQVAPTAETTPVSRGKPSSPQPRLSPGAGTQPQAAVAAGVGHHRCHACSFTIILTQTGVTKARASAVFLPVACACAHKTTLTSEKPRSISRCMELLLSWP